MAPKQQPPQPPLQQSPSAAELVRKVAVEVMQTAGKMPPLGAARVERGSQLMSQFCSALAADCPAGDESSHANCSEFCGWVQTNCFDGITTDEHGAAVRARTRALNKSVERLCAKQEYSIWREIVAEFSPPEFESSPPASEASDPQPSAAAVEAEAEAAEESRDSDDTGAEAENDSNGAEQHSDPENEIELSPPEPGGLASHPASEASDPQPSAAAVEAEAEEAAEESRASDDTGTEAEDDSNGTEQHSDPENDVERMILDEPDDVEELMSEGEQDMSDAEHGANADSAAQTAPAAMEQEQEQAQAQRRGQVQDSAETNCSVESCCCNPEEHELPVSAEVEHSKEPVESRSKVAAHLDIIIQCFPELSRFAAHQLLQAYGYNAKHAISAYHRAKQLRQQQKEEAEAHRRMEYLRQAEYQRLLRQRQQQRQQHTQYAHFRHPEFGYLGTPRNAWMSAWA